MVHKEIDCTESQEKRKPAENPDTERAKKAVADYETIDGWNTELQAENEELRTRNENQSIQLNRLKTEKH